jgi:hypothetical protein
MVMVSLLGQNDEMVRFQSLVKKAGSAFPIQVAALGMALSPDSSGDGSTGIATSAI